MHLLFFLQHLHRSLLHHIQSITCTPSSTSNLPLRDRLDPAKSHIQSKDDGADDPEALGVVLAVVSENDGEDDTSKIACCAGEATDDSIGCRSC
jgi:hypothetical protein